MAELNERDAKVVQWLNEAHAKEAELEANLTAHIALTEKQAYKKRLRQHLTETRDHKKRVAQRIRKLGGSPSTGPGVPVVGEVAGKAVAAVKGQLGAARAVITEQAETHVRNAQEELREEHVEIAIYTRIETLASEVGDRETAQLAKSIRRDEERMAKFLDAELKRLVKAVVKAEIPAAQRNGSKPARRRTTAASSGTRSRTRSTKAASSRSRASGSTSRAKTSGTRAKTSRSGSGRSSSRARTTARS